MRVSRFPSAPARIAGLLLWLFVSALALRAQTPAALPELEIPPRPTAPNDESEYRRLVLDNGLKVILLSDPKLNQSSAALAVDVGSLSDPDERQGLAHFLEHMLFLGTEKYPHEAEYGNYLRSNGGYSNAYTSGDHTNYLFEIRHEAFEGALDRFSQFFIAPLFTPEFTEREMHAVNSEHQKNLENDNYRQHQLLNTLYREDHPENHFSTGNLETLRGTTRDELLAFYHQYYSANRMNLALVGKASLDQLEAWARQYFSAVPNHQRPPLVYPPDYLTPKPALRLAMMEPLADIRELTMEFPLPAIRDDWPSKSASLIGFILGYEGEGSLLSKLKEEGLASALSAGAYDPTRDYGSFYVSMDLTPAGLEQRQRVMQLVFAAIAEVRRAGYPSYLFRERAAMARIDEMFLDKGEGSARATALARALHEYPLEVAERAPYLWLREDPAEYQRILERLRPDNMIVLLAAKGVPTDQVEPYYGTKYSYQELTGPEFAALQDLPEVAGLHLPEPNTFIPESADMLPLQPVHLIDEPALSLFYAQDTEFERPMVAEIFRVRLPRSRATVRDAVLLDFYGACVNEALNEIAYTAGVAGLHVGIGADLEGIVIQLHGYDAGAPRLLEAVAQQLVDFELDEARFAAIKDRMLRGLANFPLSDAWRIVLETRRRVVREVHFDPAQRLPVAEQITLADVRAFAREIYTRGRIESLIYGNVTAAEARKTARRLVEVMKTEAVPADQILKRRLLVMQPGEELRTVDQLAVNNANYRLELMLGSDTPEIRAATMLLASFIAEPFYSEMRTRQQLGYIVQGTAGSEEDSYFAFFLIQSGDHPPHELATRAETFLATLPAALQQLPDEAWEMIVAGVRAELEQKDKTIQDRANRLFGLAYEHEEEWDRREKTLAALDQISKERVHELLAAALDPQTHQKRVFLGYARGQEKPAGVEPTITNIEAWKEKREYR